MGDKIRVAYFKCDTQEGEELYLRTKDMLEQMDIGERKIEVNLQRNDPLSAIEAYLCDDVIIFDGSLEDQKENTGNDTGQQYDAMIEPLKASSHVLIVSRSQIPFNVLGVRKGGYPHYIRTGIAEYKETLDNKDILEWIRDTFMKEDSGLFNSHKLEHNYYQGLSDKEKAEILNTMIREKTDESGEGSGEDAQIFISYLSRYSTYFSGKGSWTHEYTVEDLREYISRTQEIPMDQIGYFPPGNLSRELMTVQRRWEIISVTDDFIRKCKQFWILAAPGYGKSWWTLSERVTLSYILAEDPEKCPDIYVARYDGERCSFRVEKYLDVEAKKKILPKISKDTIQELARCFVNSRPGGVGYESIWLMKLLHYLPDPAVRFFGRQSYKLMEEFMPMFLEDMGETAEEYAEEAVQSVRSNVYTKSFWEDWIMECPYCKMKESDAKYNKETFLDPGKSSFCHVVRKQDLLFDSGENRYTYSCKTCGRKFYFKKGYNYRWYPIRGGNIHTGPGGRSIEKRTTFYFVDP